MVTHVKQDEIGHGSPIHISHLFDYVSAYERNADTVADLAAAVDDALTVAKSTGRTQIVDQDGEMCFHITPDGYLILMVPWRHYTAVQG